MKYVKLTLVGVANLSGDPGAEIKVKSFGVIHGLHVRPAPAALREHNRVAAAGLTCRPKSLLALQKGQHSGLTAHKNDAAGTMIWKRHQQMIISRKIYEMSGNRE